MLDMEEHFYMPFLNSVLSDILYYLLGISEDLITRYQSQT